MDSRMEPMITIRSGYRFPAQVAKSLTKGESPDGASEPEATETDKRPFDGT